MSNTDIILKRTPLYNEHITAGAKMVPFSGWAMPVQYSGIIEEHLHTRERAGIFDICHMGEFLLKGPDAESDLERLVTCRVSDMVPGKCRYGFILNENGGIIDDLIVFKISGEEFMLVVNSATTEKDLEWIRKNISPVTALEDISDGTAKIDIQGPSSSRVLEKIIGRDPENDIKRFFFKKTDIGGTEVLLSRTGYTGETGYELFFSKDKAVRIWRLLMENEEVKPIGLGARDTLRMEMGYSLYGSDIDEEHSPLGSGLSAFVSMKKKFIGKEALLLREKKGIERILRGFICEARRSARRGFSVICGGSSAGIVTSGGFSPSIQKGIGLCYINTEHSAAGTGITLTDGKIDIKAEITELPIYKR